MGKGFSSARPDGVSAAAADAHDLTSYTRAIGLLSETRAPFLARASNPHKRVFFAAFDGTGNDMNSDERQTNVGRAVDGLIDAFERRRHQVGLNYLAGIGTQENPIVRVADQAIGATYDSKIEEMYMLFIGQAAEWHQRDPNAQISLASIGFSRGAVQAAGFARLVHERGIQDPEGIHHVRGEGGRMEIVFTRPPLVPPGQVAQVLGLFDPVATGVPSLDDVRLPPSVLSAFQITAEDERRDLFPGMDIVPRGLSEDHRFLNVVVGGSHCDIGGGYRLDGLSIRAGNLMADYLNALTDTPLLAKRAVPEDPGMSVVHRSDDHLPFYSTWRFRLGDGRAHMPPTDGSLLCALGIACADPEPVDPALASRFEYQPVAIGPLPGTMRSTADREPAPAPAGHDAASASARLEVERLFERLSMAAGHRDVEAARSIGRDYLHTPSAADWLASARREPLVEGVVDSPRRESVVETVMDSPRRDQPVGRDAHDEVAVPVQAMRL